MHIHPTIVIKHPSIFPKYFLFALFEVNIEYAKIKIPKKIKI